MRRFVSVFVVGLLALGMATVAVADDGDVYQAGGNFIPAKKMRADATPILWAVMSIPPDITVGTVFTINCRIEAQKNAKGAGLKGVTGSAATFANRLNVSNGSWLYFGLVGSGLPFTTDQDGVGFVSTGPVTAGIWANDPGSNDTLSIGVTFTNAKKVVKTSLGCELVIGG